MTPRVRIVSALSGGTPDRIPFTCKDPIVRRGETELRLRNEGMAIVTDCPVLTRRRAEVELVRHEYWQNGKQLIRETFKTPVGEVYQTLIPGGAYDTDRIGEFVIKQPDDYAIVRFMAENEVYTPDYEKFTVAEKDRGESGFVFAGWMPPTPLMQMLWCLMGPERFAFDRHDHPKLFFDLYHTLLERQLEQYHIAADSPALVAHIEENMTAEMIGPQAFERYCVPCYDKFAEMLHSRGKLLAVHMDGKLKMLAEAIAKSKIDIIEAFCPIPDGDMELSHARQVWAEKVIWLNFPSPAHLWLPERIAEYTRQILDDVAPGNRFLLGITEDVPDAVWQNSLPAISNVLKKWGGLPIAPKIF